MRSMTQEQQETKERELLHTFCLGARELLDQLARLETTGTLSYPILHDLIGTSVHKGPLWELKDSAHNIFRTSRATGSPGTSPGIRPGTSHGTMLDWSLGYIFHETIKLLEDARLRQAYLPRIAELSSVWPKGYEAMLEQFAAIEGQTQKSAQSEASRIKLLIDLSLQLFTLFFAGQARHRPLARLLFDHQETIGAVFGDEFPHFLRSVYGDTPEIRYVEAARSLLAAGRARLAQEALDKALAIAPRCEEAHALRQQCLSGTDTTA